jgi:hypothetical protein
LLPPTHNEEDEIRISTDWITFIYFLHNIRDCGKEIHEKSQTKDEICPEIEKQQKESSGKKEDGGR